MVVSFIENTYFICLTSNELSSDMFTPSIFFTLYSGMLLVSQFFWKFINTLLNSKQLPISRPTFRQDCTQSKLKGQVCYWNGYGSKECLNSTYWTGNARQSTWAMSLGKSAEGWSRLHSYKKKEKSMSNLLEWDSIHFGHW